MSLTNDDILSTTDDLLLSSRVVDEPSSNVTTNADSTVDNSVEEEKVESVSNENDSSVEDEDGRKRLKKVGTAVAGGCLIAVGIPLIPFPAPIGVPTVAGGLALLATEFPAAQNLIDKSRDNIEKFADGSDEGKNEEKDGEITEEGFEIVVVDECDEQKLAESSDDRRKDYVSKVHPHDEIDMAIDNALEGAKNNLRKLTKKTLLPLMNNISSKRVDVNSDTEVKEDYSFVEKIESQEE